MWTLRCRANCETPQRIHLCRRQKDPQEKNRDEHWQGEVVGNHHTKQKTAKLFAHANARFTRKDSANQRLKAKIMKITLPIWTFSSMSPCSLVHKPFLIPQTMKIPDAKATVDRSWDKLKNIPAWQLLQVKSKLEVIDEAGKEGKTVQ